MAERGLIKEGKDHQRRQNRNGHAGQNDAGVCARRAVSRTPRVPDSKIPHTRPPITLAPVSAPLVAERCYSVNIGIRTGGLTTLGD